MIICTFFYPWCLDAVSNCILHSLSHTIDKYTWQCLIPVADWLLVSVMYTKKPGFDSQAGSFFSDIVSFVIPINHIFISMISYDLLLSCQQLQPLWEIRVVRNRAEFTAHRYEEEKSSCGLLEGLWSLNQRTWLGSIPRQELSHIVSLIVIFTTTTTNWNKY